MNRFDGQRRRLIWLLAGIFGVLAAASTLIVFEAAERLRYESFYAQRLLAESFSSRVRDEFRQRIEQEATRPPTDYDFLIVSGERYVQRSPLSQLPPDSSLPGVIGFFQVDADGGFSTPLLPPDAADPAALDLTAAEYQARQRVQREIRALLEVAGDPSGKDDSQLTPGRTRASREGALETNALKTGALETNALKTGALETDALESDALESDMPRTDVLSRVIAFAANESAAPQLGADSTAATAVASVAKPAAENPVAAAENRTPSSVDVATPAAGLSAGARLGSAEQLKRKAENVDQTTANRALYDELSSDEPKLVKRGLRDNKEGKLSTLNLRERFATLEAELPAATEESPTEVRTQAIKQVIAADADQMMPEPQISVFESAVDPFQLARLTKDHLLLYRNVWLDDQRIVQGVIIEQAPFLETLVSNAFSGTALAATTSLAVVLFDEIISLQEPSRRYAYRSGSAELAGELLLTANLPAPADELKLIFSITELPFGAGGVTLAWSALVLALVLSGGFVALLWLGRRQIQLAEQQEDFVSAVSHELKTPLTAIRMYGEMLRAGWVSEDKRRTYYDYIFTESERLSRMIGNVLTLARIGRSKHHQLTVKPERVSVLLDQLDSRVASAIDGAGLTLRRQYAADATAASVLVDQDAFLQVMINLVDNGIKFSANASEHTIEIGCALANGQVSFRVRDFGPGVARDQMRKIFKLFYRAESELTRETVGTGIGLALVRELAAQMNGSVDVVNREPGAEFRLLLPQTKVSVESPDSEAIGA